MATTRPAGLGNVNMKKTRTQWVDGMAHVTLYDTEILQWNPATRALTLNDGGFNTVTTTTRMNDALHELGIPGFIARHNFIVCYYPPGCGKVRKGIPANGTHIIPEADNA